MHKVFIALAALLAAATPVLAQEPPAAGQPLLPELRDTTLAALIAEAHRANTDIRVAEGRLAAARASRRLAALDLLPSVVAVGSAVRQQQSLALTPGLPAQLPQQDLWDVGFDAFWEIDVFGRISSNVRARQAYAASAESMLEHTQLTISAEVARSYFELRGAQRQLAVSNRNAENQRRIVQITEDRLVAGRGNAFDTERAKAALYLTLAATPTLEAQIAIHRQRLATMLGRVPEALPKTLDSAGPLPSLPDTIYVGSADQLIRRRPDVQAAERALQAERLEVTAARAEYMPRLTIGARAGYVSPTPDALSRAGNSRLFIGPALSFPLFDLTRVRQGVSVARAGRDAAQAEHRGAVIRALNESNAAIVTYDRAHARLAILENAVASSMRAAELAQQRFEAGLTDFLQVLDAQRTLLDAENQLAQGHTAAATALVALYKAVGGTWPVR